MSEEKKETDIHDLKPSKDAKGGGRGRREGAGPGRQGGAGLDTAGRGKHYQQ
jgi:hypothetical protein